MAPNGMDDEQDFQSRQDFRDEQDDPDLPPMSDAVELDETDDIDPTTGEPVDDMAAAEAAADWFMVLLGPWGREDQPDGDPDMAEVPHQLLRALRERASTWSDLGIASDDTIGCYQDGRLHIGVEVGEAARGAAARDTAAATTLTAGADRPAGELGDEDRPAGELGDEDVPTDEDVPIAVLRIEISDDAWEAAWTSPDEGVTADTMAEAEPRGEVTHETFRPDGAATAVSEAVDWLDHQLRRPIERLVWHETAPAARLWRLADTRTELYAEGTPPRDAGTATVRSVRERR